MSVVVVTPPDPVVSIEAAKRHLRVDHADEDVYIGELVAVATAHIDGPAGWLGLSLGEQTLALQVPCFEGACGALELPCGPVIAVEAVSYIAPGGAMATLDPSAYVLIDSSLVPSAGLMWPSVQLRADAVRVRYRAGHPATTDDPPKPTLPAPIRHAILLMVGDLYANRESGGVGSVSFEVKMPTTVANLLAPFRAWRV